MRMEQSFTVAAPVDEVWRALVDVQRVAPCLPGAEVTEAGEDGVYRGLFTVKLGPTTVAYAGTLRMEQVDEAERRAVMAARGSDRRGQGGATATIASTVREQGEVTAVDVVTDFTITGRLARFGRGGMIADVSRRLLAEFAACLQSSLVEGRGAAAAPAGAAAAATASATGEPAARGLGTTPRGPAPAAAGPAASAPEADAAAVPPRASEAEAPTSAPQPTGEPAPTATAADAPPPAGSRPASRPLDAGKLGWQVARERMRGWWARLGQRLRAIGGKR
ncbi:SRPBCC family protein [Conexibacter arvalis]|uniref:Carbon monoxide dehydrogenase subunit G n=1 Tax=Conexibacter arvalis TaxID=912552 RepID=A0A840IL58_9ACTN|nr:SRPBCC family protein [Conexibacter arvalis]MBB4664873.1 carbon monoxide dehydrogenase subunit G [Conexibacter arvalis]